MPDNIYLVDPITKIPERFDPISFSALGIKERSDLQKWVLQHPQMLGEELLVLTEEFSQFDNSNKRLDILALDREGQLVIVELKLDAKDSLAELQAIRYAAFCSTMTMEDAIAVRASFEQETKAAAAEAIRFFLEVSELPELNNKPRIMIAAGSMDDQELTSTVMWLRSFGLDITCVELTPYKLTAPERFVLVPRVIIPIPEAKEYLINVQRKEAAQQQAKTAAAAAPELGAFWGIVISAFNDLNTGRPVDKPRRWYVQIQSGYTGVHWEWCSRPNGTVDVALHFENTDAQVNKAGGTALTAHSKTIGEGLPYPFETFFRVKTVDLHFRVPLAESALSEDNATDLAALMKTLIERTAPILQQVYGDAAD